MTNNNWLYIPEINKDVEVLVHDKGKSFNELKGIYGDFEDKLLTKEEDFFRSFIMIIKTMGFNVGNIKKSGCDKDKEFGVCLHSKEVNNIPDFSFFINNRKIDIEVKNSKYDLDEFHLKKFQIDKYNSLKNIFILWVMDCDKSPHFTILQPVKIVNSKVWKNPKYGYKEVYCLNKKDYTWFSFKPTDQLKVFLKDILEIEC